MPAYVCLLEPTVLGYKLHSMSHARGCITCLESHRFRTPRARENSSMECRQPRAEALKHRHRAPRQASGNSPTAFRRSLNPLTGSVDVIVEVVKLLDVTSVAKSKEALNFPPAEYEHKRKCPDGTQRESGANGHPITFATVTPRSQATSSENNWGQLWRRSTSTFL